LNPFFLYARWNHGKKLIGNIVDLWKAATDVPLPFGTFLQDDSSPKDWAKRFRDHLETVLEECPIPEKEQDDYFLRAERSALKRIDAIAGEKHRKSDWKAGQLLLAVALEQWRNRSGTETHQPI
jgi:hypothetical protein